VKVFSRHLRDVTAAVPEIVELTRRLAARELMVDGEVIALRPDGTPHPFQMTMRRFGRKLDVTRLREALPLTPFFFDALYLDGQSLVDEPLSRRFAALAERAPTLLVPRIVAATPAEAEAFLEEAMRSGHEGVMAKSLETGCAAGRRGQAWLKIKPAHTLDLVILAAEWGGGQKERRAASGPGPPASVVGLAEPKPEARARSSGGRAFRPAGPAAGSWQG